MANATSLKESLQTNIPKLVTIRKRGATYPETDYQTKQPTGHSIFLYIFTDETGQELKHYAKEREEDVLRMFNVGETVQVVRQEMMKGDKRIAFLVWTDRDGVEAKAAANPPARSNVQQATLEKHQQKEEDKWDKIAIGKCIFGYMQALIQAGKSVEDAAILAYQALEAQEVQTQSFIEKHR